MTCNCKNKADAQIWPCIDDVYAKNRTWSWWCETCNWRSLKFRVKLKKVA